MAENTSKDETKGLLSIGESSDYLGVSIDTLRRWEKKGKVNAYRSPGGHRYFKKDELDDLFGTKYERAEDEKPRKIKAKVVEEVEEPAITESPEKSAKDSEEEKTKEIGSNGNDKPFLTTMPSEDKVIDREPKPVKIPEASPVRIIRSEARAYNPPATINKAPDSPPPSILTPPASIPAPPKEETAPSETPQTNTEKKRLAFFRNKQNRKTIIAVIVTVIFFVIALMIFLRATAGPQVLSPVPY